MHDYQKKYCLFSTMSKAVKRNMPLFPVFKMYAHMIVAYNIIKGNIF